MRERGRICAPRQVANFHANFDYLFSCLSISPYKAKTDFSAVRSSGIKKTELLPGTTTLWKISDLSYCPTLETVNKIVRFYNANIQPPTTTDDFLNTRLALSRRSANHAQIDERFLGCFYGYYFSPSVRGQLCGAMLKLYKDSYGAARAAMVLDLWTDAAMRGMALSNAFESPSYASFLQYLDLQNDFRDRQCTYLEGGVETTGRAVSLFLRGKGADERRAMITLNTKDFPDTSVDYYGGLGYMLCSSDNAYPATFSKMGLVRTDICRFSLTDASLFPALSLVDSEQIANLTGEADREWYNLIVNAFPRK